MLLLSAFSRQNKSKFLFTICGLSWQLIMVMASHCYLIGPAGESFVEYLVNNCALPDQEKHQIQFNNSYHILTYRRYEV